MSNFRSIEIPDLGEQGEVDVIDMMMSVGDRVETGAALLTVETDKASMDIPCQTPGVVREVLIGIGDKVKQGDVFVRIEIDAISAAHPNEEINNKIDNLAEAANASNTTAEPTAVLLAPAVASNSTSTFVQAGPSSRRLARKLGIDISQVAGTGRRGRIVKEDVQAHVKLLLSRVASDTHTLASPALPDISKFGPVRTESLNKIEQVTSENMQRAWREIPHAWLQQNIDIDELDKSRKRLKAEVEGLTMTAFIIKSLALALVKFPRFNCALDAHAQQLIYRDYINIGVAVDTPRGLLIAVVRDVNLLSIAAIAAELSRLSALAREGKLQVSDMQGASMTVSSLGALGVDGLQPIVNWPEVAILGVARATVQASYSGSSFVPRLILPLTLGFDHRVINGADGAKFLGYLKQLMNDPIRLTVMS